jgi:hypothetical protein
MITITIIAASPLTQSRHKHHHYDPSTRLPAGRLQKNNDRYRFIGEFKRDGNIRYRCARCQGKADEAQGEEDKNKEGKWSDF